jgi:hypothetical protein
MVTVGLQANAISVLLGKGDGTFQPPVNYQVGAPPNFVAIGDLTGNHKLDLVVVSDGSYAVLLGNGDGTFQPAVTHPLNTGTDRLLRVLIGDVNGDNKPGLVIDDYDAGTINVLLGNGDGTFQAPVAYNAGPHPHWLALADLTHDNHLDAIVANDDNFGGNYAFSVLLGKGDGTFGAPTSYPTSTGTVGLTLGDFNHDGNLDVAVSDEYTEGIIDVYLGNGDGTFRRAGTYDAGGGLSRMIVAADFTGDGNLDLAVANSSTNNVSVLYGNGDGTFQPAQTYAVGSGPDGIAVGDFNNDGAPDLVVGNSGSKTISLLLNEPPPATHFGISTTGSSTAGSPLTVNVEALTALNSVAMSFSGTVHFTSSDPQASLPADYTFTTTDRGEHSFTTSLKTAGQQTITVALVLPAGSPVAYYRFEEGSGNQIINSVGNSVAGTHDAVYSTNVPVNPIPLTGQANGYSLQFNNTSALITAQPFIFNKGFGDATFEFWINAPNLSNSGIFWTRPDSTDADRFNIYVLAGGVFGFDYREPNGQLHTLLPAGPFIIPLNTWAHIAVTRSENTYRFYKNGSLVYTATDTNPNLPDTTSWTIGGRAGFPFTGLIDEVRLTNGTLSPNQFLDAPQPLPVSAVVQVTPAAASTLLVAGYPSPTTINARHAFTVTVLDAYGNIVTDFVGTIHFSSTNPSATLPPNYTFQASDQGVHTFYATFRGPPADYSLTATVTRAPKIKGTQFGILVTKPADELSDLES